MSEVSGTLLKENGKGGGSGRGGGEEGGGRGGGGGGVDRRGWCKRSRR